ncbi:MAG: cell division protein FtsZ [Oscillospiraceae bacterium]|jgi:cell division protein FtsZ|nr:cell division protein FtsZ [Oscillospiraceae bacterium]MBQ4302481.1 cell division protein FtsZ [Oscillospiraceae bacterium]MBQ5468884.1 cell division protein FtsZ [Oscillospiraceae bacterium]MBQ6030793.1 cell division protein FtsZ [Oscillospiraceae bacterium]MBQ6280627.1 cell division protein FtsZ [Oscillospiraceae bacterium]
MADYPEKVVNIKVIGVGGAGNNVVNRMLESGVEGVDFLVVNTDRQDLNKSKCPNKLPIGEKLTGGMGAGSKPEIGKKSAEESRAAIAKALEGADMVFITAGMGGGTGTGAAPIIADLAHEAGILTVGVVTRPFRFEGANRSKQADEGISALSEKVDSLIVIPNDRLKFVTDQKITFANAFGIADDVLKQAVTSISELVSYSEKVIINLDFADVSSIMKNAGRAHMGVGTASGRDKAEQAAMAAVSSPLLETSINGATGVLINVTGSQDLGLDDVETAANIVMEAANPDANIIFGATFADGFEDEMRVTVIATGFEGSKKEEEKKPDRRTFSALNNDFSARPAQQTGRPTTQPAPAPVAPVRPSESDINDIDAVFDIFRNK